jgi:hypothetical protein
VRTNSKLPIVNVCGHLYEHYDDAIELFVEFCGVVTFEVPAFNREFKARLSFCGFCLGIRQFPDERLWISTLAPASARFPQTERDDRRI